LKIGDFGENFLTRKEIHFGKVLAVCVRVRVCAILHSDIESFELYIKWGPQPLKKDL